MVKASVDDLKKTNNLFIFLFFFWTANFDFYYMLKNGKKLVKLGLMTTQELADQEGVARVTVTMWCKKHGINRKLGVNGIMEYDLTKKDIDLFKNRKPKGRPKINVK